MKFEPVNNSNIERVTALFIQVFSDSEGENEGHIIGSLVSDLFRTTPSSELAGYLIKEGDVLAGSIIFSKLTLDSDIKAMILSPVAIATDYQRKGLGQRLIKYGIEQIIQQDVALVVTYGDPNFYSKVGFEPISEKTIVPPFKLSYPHGWQALSLDNKGVFPINEKATCVTALMNQKYW